MTIKIVEGSAMRSALVLLAVVSLGCESDAGTSQSQTDAAGVGEPADAGTQDSSDPLSDAASLNEGGEAGGVRSDAGLEGDASGESGIEVDGAVSSFPTESTTGVPPGINLSPSGPLDITSNGTVVDALDVDGDICVRADNVRITRTRVRGTISSASGGDFGACPGPVPKNLVIEDVEVVGPWKAAASYSADELGAMATTVAIQHSNYTCRRCKVHRWGRGFQVNRNVLIEDSLVFDLVGSSMGGSFLGPDGISHNSCIGGNGAVNATYRRNHLRCGFINGQGGMSGALVLYSDANFLPAQDVRIEGNLLNGGSYCLYPGVKNKPSDPTPMNIEVIDNRFGRLFYPTCGANGPVALWTKGNGNVWSGNAWADTGMAISQ